jgi:tetratricopeptide (TPR) repeat protein
MFAPQPEDATQFPGWFRHNSVWMLATSPVPAMRDAARAVELARKAVERNPKQGLAWSTLGVALYGAGDWGAAVDALERSRELVGEGFGATTGFVLAMAYWRRGDHDVARTQFHRAVTAAGPLAAEFDDEVERFRAEAAALLGEKLPSIDPKEDRPGDGAVKK